MNSLNYKKWPAKVFTAMARAKLRESGFTLIGSFACDVDLIFLFHIFSFPLTLKKFTRLTEVGSSTATKEMEIDSGSSEALTQRNLS